MKLYLLRNRDLNIIDFIWKHVTILKEMQSLGAERVLEHVVIYLETFHRLKNSNINIILFLELNWTEKCGKIMFIDSANYESAFCSELLNIL